MLSIYQIRNVPVSSNCYVIFDKAVGESCIVVDPGTPDNRELITFLKKEDLKISFIILTHEHFDHCWGVNQLLEKFSIPIVCSRLCKERIRDEKKNCSVFYGNNQGFTINSKVISIESLEYDLPFANRVLYFFHTPGHSDASVCVKVDNYLFTGDTLIKDTRTVTKLPTGSMKRLHYSINRLRELQGNGYIVCPGHGDMFELDIYDLSIAIG